MPRKVKEEFEVEYLQVMDKEGEVGGDVRPEVTDEELKEMYEEMVRVRKFDETALKLQREGRMGTYASIRGQEASNIGPAFALGDEDWIFPAFRENGTLISRGMPMHKIFQYWGWDERGADYPQDVNAFTMAVPVSTQIPHAVGYAWANKLQGRDTATAVFFGDGATSKGDFHEALNFAGSFELPLVAINQNNQWAISVPRERQSASETLAQKAISYGFQGIQVDGNDILAVYRAVEEAARKAREEGTPTMIECYTYRLEDHTTADEASRYRDEEEVEKWRERDPIKRVRLYLEEQGLWDEGYQEELEEEIDEEIKEEVEKYEEIEDPDIEDIFRYVFEEMTPQLENQLEYLKKSQEEVQKFSGGEE